MDIKSVAMDFFYKNTFKTEAPEAYERLIYDCTVGEAGLFIRGDEAEAAWAVIDPIEQHWGPVPPSRRSSTRREPGGPRVPSASSRTTGDSGRSAPSRTRRRSWLARYRAGLNGWFCWAHRHTQMQIQIGRAEAAPRICRARKAEVAGSSPMRCSTPDVIASRGASPLFAVVLLVMVLAAACAVWQGVGNPFVPDRRLGLHHPDSAAPDDRVMCGYPSEISATRKVLDAAIAREREVR